MTEIDHGLPNAGGAPALALLHVTKTCNVQAETTLEHPVRMIAVGLEVVVEGAALQTHGLDRLDLDHPYPVVKSLDMM